MKRKSKLLTTFLSMCPGAGHMYLGLMQKGLYIMALFFSMIYLESRFFIFDEIMIFSPLVVFYSIFDALKNVNNINGKFKKEKGLAVLYAFVPGLGHMYLGFIKKGLYIMALFFFMVYFASRFSIFDGIMLFSPLVVFYSIFDALNTCNKMIENNFDYDNVNNNYNNINNNYKGNDTNNQNINAFNTNNPVNQNNNNFNDNINSENMNMVNLDSNRLNNSVLLENNGGQVVDFNNIDKKSKIVLKKKNQNY